MKLKSLGNGAVRINFSILTNPIFIYSFIWLLAICSTSLRVTTNLPSVNVSALLLILGNVFSFALLYFTVFISAKKARRKKILIDRFDLDVLLKFSKKILLVWALGTLGEVVFCGGFPLLWVLVGISKNYTEFGIPTFHGLMNGLFFFSTTVFSIDLCVNPGKGKFTKLLPLMSWPIMMLGRGIFLGMVLQMGVAYLVIKGLNLVRASIVILAAFGLVLLFGFIGDNRQTGNPFMYLVDNQYYSTFESLPSGILWVYIYLTSPIGNLISNVDTVRPTYAPTQTLGALLPSVLRDKFKNGNADSIELVDPSLNVSTFYSNFLSDYGVFGAFLLVALLQLIVVVIYLRLREGNVWAVPAYAVLYQCMVFSVFVNLFLLQTYIIQILLSIYCAGGIRKARRTLSIAKSRMRALV
jgi:oligosaccharide repeat unit polymerase